MISGEALVVGSAMYVKRVKVMKEDSVRWHMNVISAYAGRGVITTGTRDR